MKYLELEDEKVEPYVCDEDNYTTMYHLIDTDQLKYEDFQDELPGACFNDPPLFVYHISKDELCEILGTFIIILENHVKARNN